MRAARRLIAAGAAIRIGRLYEGSCGFHAARAGREIRNPMPSRPAKHTIFDTPILSSLTRLLSRIYLRLIGWKPSGALPDVPKFVLIAAPHTSNWDFPIMLALAFCFGARIHWIGKDSLFPGLARPVARYLGGIPVDRSKPGGMVQASIDELKAADKLIIVVPPEGTRGKSAGWKSGFYHIAHGAGVPVVMGFLDYAKKTGGFGPMLPLTGNIDDDMEAIRAFYGGIAAKYPELYTEPRLRS